MTYKKKVYILLSIIGALALTYAATLVFDPEQTGSRSSSYTWLEPGLAGRISRIAISEDGEIKELFKRDNQWFVAHNGKEYPARQLRVEDFISVLTSRAPYPVRSTSAASHTRLGLDEDAASRVTVYTENGTLLDLLLGADDSTGREIYLRKAGQNEVRSGDSKIGSYTTGSVNNWYNLRLIPESEDGKIAVDSVQRLSVYSPQEAQVFSRRNREWTVSGLAVSNPDQTSIDSYIRSVLNTEADDFDDSVSGDDPALNHSRIVLELGNGSVKTIRLGEPDESGRRTAHVAGTQYVYSLAPWAAGRLFRTAADFERQ